MNADPATAMEPPHAEHGGQADVTAREMGHGGGKDMQSMARDMRNRFWIALAFSLPIFVFSPMGLPFTPRPPFGIALNLFLFPFATAAVLYPAWPFVVAAYRAILSRSANMAVLVVLSVGTGYLFSVGATFVWGGQQFYEAAAILLVFILLGHWLEMRARWRVRCHQQAHEPGPAQGDGIAARSRGGGVDRRGGRRRHRRDPPWQQDSRRWNGPQRRLSSR